MFQWASAAWSEDDPAVLGIAQGANSPLRLSPENEVQQ
jgi:hypothetical protein